MYRVRPMNDDHVCMSIMNGRAAQLQMLRQVVDRENHDELIAQTSSAVTTIKESKSD